jgi:hypothetical protein
MAIVVHTDIHENLGMFVNVLGPCRNRPGCWRVRSICGARARKDGSVHPQGIAADECLWPIRGDAAEVKRRRSLARLAALRSKSAS